MIDNGFIIEKMPVKKSNADVVRIQHGYDRGGNRLYRRDTVATAAGQALNELYTYDQMNQLTAMQRGVLNAAGDAVSSKTFGEQFTFDTTGNWLNYKQDANGDGTFEVNQTRTHNLANEILTISGGNTLVSHDRNGCMTKVPQPNSLNSAYTLVYDAWNRLISVSDGDTLVVTYVYDASNHRIKTTVGDETRLCYFNQQWQCVEERVGTTVDATWIYGLRYIDDIVCRMKNTEVLYALQDPNWNVVALVTPSGTVAERLTYDSFGKPTFRNASFVAKTTSSYSWTKTFTGQVYDSETGLMLYRNRYYHPTLGRFITRDPIGYDSDGVSLYRYIENKPDEILDPLGEMALNDLVKMDQFERGVQGSVSYATPNIPTPIPGVTISCSISLSGSLSSCCSHCKENILSTVSISLACSGRYGTPFGKYQPKKRDASGNKIGRNTRIGDPRPTPPFGKAFPDIKNKQAAKLPNPKYHKGGLGVSLGGMASLSSGCPSEGCEYNATLFVHGAIGLWAGVEFNMEKQIYGGTTSLFDSISGGATTGVYGAYVEIGLTGTGTCSWSSETGHDC